MAGRAQLLTQVPVQQGAGAAVGGAPAVSPGVAPLAETDFDALGDATSAFVADVLASDETRFWVIPTSGHRWTAVRGKPPPFERYGLLLRHFKGMKTYGVAPLCNALVIDLD